MKIFKPHEGHGEERTCIMKLEFVLYKLEKMIFEFSNPVFIKILDECCFGFVVCMSNIFSNRNVKTTKRDAKSDLIRKIYDFYSTNTEQF